MRIPEEIKRLKENHLFRQLREFDSSNGRFATIAGQQYLIFCSNDYLGLSQNKEIAEAVKDGVDRFGVGSTASRLVAGTLSPHTKLESMLAEYIGSEAALLFNSGYAANSGILPAIAGKGDVLLADKLNHASIVDGCLLSKAEFIRYPHKDMASLEKLLKKHSGRGEVWVVTDGMFSMDGDLAPLDEISGLVNRHGAKLYVDDAHAFGVLGKDGRGTPSALGVQQIDVHVGTLGKAAGICGAFAACSFIMKQFLINRARSFIYSTSPPPAIAAGGCKAVEVLQNFSDGRAAFLRQVDEFHKKLEINGFAVSSKRFIIPLIIGDSDKAIALCEKLWGDNIYLQAIRPPTVPAGTARLRLTLSLNQKTEDQDRLLELLKPSLPIFKEGHRRG